MFYFHYSFDTWWPIYALNENLLYSPYRSGLQLGDQILSCNDMTFEGNNLNFNIAVAQMRGRRFLDLIIRRGAGLDILGNAIF